MLTQRTGKVHLDNKGLAKRFERRTELLFSKPYFDVVAAEVPEAKLKEYVVARIEDVLDGYNDTLLIFGMPNVALINPNADNTGFQRFAAYSVWREESEIVDITRPTGSLVQSGVWVRFLDLPDEAHTRIREAMEYYEGTKFRTCVNGIMHVLDRALFTSGGEKLTGITFPHTLIDRLRTHGLEFDNQPIQLQNIRTTRRGMQRYTWKIMYSELTALCRHAKKTKVGAFVDRVLGAPIRWIRGSQPEEPSPVIPEIAPALPSDVDYLHDIKIRITRARTLGQAIQQVLGPYAFFEAEVDRVNPDDYFNRALRPFPQKNPPPMTRLKKWLLFSRPVIWALRLVIGARQYYDCGSYDERHVYDMFRTHSEKHTNKYNLVIIRMPGENGRQAYSRMVLTRLTWGWKFLDWILSKHVFMSGYLWEPETDDQEPDKTQAYVVWAGEVWKTILGELVISDNSGTYQPNEEKGIQALTFVRAVLPHLRIKRMPL